MVVVLDIHSWRSLSTGQNLVALRKSHQIVNDTIDTTLRLIVVSLRHLHVSYKNSVVFGRRLHTTAKPFKGIMINLL